MIGHTNKKLLAKYIDLSAQELTAFTAEMENLEALIRERTRNFSSKRLQSYEIYLPRIRLLDVRWRETVHRYLAVHILPSVLRALRPCRI